METVQELKEKIEAIELKRKENLAKIVGIEPKQILVFDNRIVFTAKNLTEVKKIMGKWKPFTNSQEIKHSRETIYLTSHYRVDIDNGFYSRKLRFSYENLNKDQCTIEIDFKDFDYTIFESVLTKTVRQLYDTETVYVNLPSHYKKFKDIRVESFRFRGKNINWYGGNQTLICESYINEMLDIIEGF